MRGIASLVLILLLIYKCAAETCIEINQPNCDILEIGSLHPHDNCNYFYRCDELKQAAVFACPDEKIFTGDKQGLKICSYETDQIKCQTRCEILEKSAVNEEDSCAPYCGNTPQCQLGMRGDKLPYPPDCNKYIYCIDTLGTISTCPNNDHFSPSLKTCTSPESAGCIYCIPQ